MKHIYPAVFHPEQDGGYSIWFPDIHQGATQGETLSEGIEMAEDFLMFALYEMETAKEQIPVASNIKSVSLEGDEFVTLISVETNDARRWHENKLVNKTLVIPSWLNEKAVAANINFSQTLQKALRSELQVTAVE